MYSVNLPLPLYPRLPKTLNTRKFLEKMAVFEKTAEASWCATSASCLIRVRAYGRIFSLDENSLVSRSAKVAKMVKEKQKQDQILFRDIPADAETFSLATKFCLGFEPALSPENVIPLACVASYLEMTEDHSPNNLLNKTCSFFKHAVLPDWNQSVKAFQTCQGSVLRHATCLGLVESCLNSIATKAVSDPRLLIRPPLVESFSDDAGSFHVPSQLPLHPHSTARRRLFETAADRQNIEVLTSLPLHLFELAVSTVARHRVPPEFLADCLFQYAMEWALPDDTVEESTPNNPCHFEMKIQRKREVLETVEKLLPNETKSLPCKSLFKMLRWAIRAEASRHCRDGFELRIGKQLQEAAVEDLMVPFSSYSIETRYDIECVMRILKNFYANYSSGDPSGLIQVMELITDFLTHVSEDPNLKKEMFISLTGMVGVTLKEIGRSTDGVYSLIDVYLSAHGHLTVLEREEVCKVLDVYKMSTAACAHAAQNERLPMRVAVQVLFVMQLRLQEAMEGGLQPPNWGEKNMEEEEDKMRKEMERVEGRVMELEREYGRMKREIVRGGRRGESLWREMKRKFGCTNGLYENCYVKIHPRNGV